MSIQCQSYANLVPFSRQCIPIQCQSIPILRQSNVNPCQLTSVHTDNTGIVKGTSTIAGAYQSRDSMIWLCSAPTRDCQSGSVLVPIHPNLLPILCLSGSNSSQSDANPVPALLNLLPIQNKSDANLSRSATIPVPIRRQCSANQVSTLSNLIPIWCQSIANPPKSDDDSLSIRCQSVVEPLSIR